MGENELVWRNLHCELRLEVLWGMWKSFKGIGVSLLKDSVNKLTESLRWFWNIRNTQQGLLINNNGVKMDNFLTKDTEIDIDVSSYSSGTYYLYFDSSDSKQGCSPQDEEMVLTKIILNK